MTIEELSQLYYLNREIEFDQKRLQNLQGLAESPRAAQLTGMPRAPGNDSIVEKYAAEIVDLQAIIAAKQIQCIHQRNRLERYIADIDDSETRWIFKLRFVHGLPWSQVAASLGDGHTADRVKKVCYRYLRREEDQAEGRLYEAEKRADDYERGLRQTP